MTKLFVIGCLLFLTSCSEYVISSCRHRAVECALVYGEVVGEDRVRIAIGPTSGVQWHAQAYINDNDDDITWIVNDGYYCIKGKQEPFTPVQNMSISKFLDNQFLWIR